MTENRYYIIEELPNGKVIIVTRMVAYGCPKESFKNREQAEELRKIVSKARPESKFRIIGKTIIG